MVARALPARAAGALARARADLDGARTAALADAWRALWLSRAIVLVAGVGAVLCFGTSGREATFDPGGATSPFGPVGDVLAAPFARWDSVWFLAIAAEGYDGARAAFFPLYPLVVRAVGIPVGSALAGGVLASTVALGVALYLLHRLVGMDHGRAVARDAVLVTALCPMAFFFSAVYSESLFLALSVGAVYAARLDRWAWAGALGALAATTRSAGIVLLVPLVLLYLWPPAGSSPARRPRLRADVLWLALVPLGVVVFCGFLALDGQDGLAPFHAQEAWLRSFAGPLAGIGDGLAAAWQGARQVGSGARDPVYFTAAGGDPFLAARHNLELFGWLVLIIAATLGAARRLPAAYVAYVVVALALPLSYPVAPQPLMSLPRFAAVLFPLAIWLALWMNDRPARRPIVLAGASGGLAVYTGIFATWHWVA